MRFARALAVALLLLASAAPGDGAWAQDKRSAEKKLERVRGELKTISQERRKIEDQRGDASRQLRKADEQVGKTSRSLTETEAALRREEAALAELQARQAEMRKRMAGEREQLATLVRAAYLMGDDAALKVLLSQDQVADAHRTLTYHRYLQRDGSQRIRQLSTDLAEADALQEEISRRQAELLASREQQRAQVAKLESDRKARASLVAELDQKYQDRAQREKALGRDARSLETLLANLRAAAARAKAEQRAAAKRAAAERAAAEREPRQQASEPGSAPRVARKPPPPKVATAPALKVGGLGWPLSGNLLAGYGGTLPDGRKSSGVMIAAPAGSTVTAVADGTVVFSEWMTGYGLILIVDHGNGYMSLYAHNDSLLRDAGDQVKRGDAVAKVGSSGAQGISALYFELRLNGQPVNPASWLQRR
nr:peptidoglycan DD-metalloendopeptidase family protein [Pseudoxanthomonas dokdonensis]